MGALITIIFYVITLYILYLVITIAVRHGIDNSVVGTIMKEKHGLQEEKFHPKDDLDKE